MNRIFGHIANIILIAVMLIPIQLAQAAPPEPSGAAIAAPSSLSGILGIIWGDPQDRRVSPRTDFFITPDGGSPVRLEMGARLPLPMARLLSLNGKHISIQGQWLSSGATEQRFQVEGLGSEAGSAEMATTAVTGPQPWVTVLCKFNDFPNDEPKPVSYFNGMYSNSFPGIDHYWREVSYGLINVSGSQVVTHWYTLPHPRSYYVYPVNGNLYFNHQLATNDCTAAADADIYYPQFVGINLMFNYELDNYAWGGSAGTTLDGVSRLWRFTWEPPWGYENIAVIAHETGHGFGLPHSSGQYGETYDNQWDIMSDTWTNCNNLRDGTYGCVGQATISYHRYLEGWIPPARLATIALNTQTTITLEPLESIPAANYMMAKIPINGNSSYFYTVEVRRKTGYDQQLPGEAVIIHEVDENANRDSPAQVIDIDNNGNTGDAGAQWQVGEVFSDPANHISVEVESVTGSGGNVVTIVNGTPAVACPAIYAWKGEYWNNTNLSGNPVLCRDDNYASFDWGVNAPDPALPADGFSARWTRTLDFTANTYRFTVLHQDGARLYVDDMAAPILDAWNSANAEDHTDIALSQGPHTVRLEMHDDDGPANIHLYYQPTQIQYWRGEYYNNSSLSGAPILVRDDPEINFDWNSGTPHPLIMAAPYAIRWTRSLTFAQGSYRFDIFHDDGARLFVDGEKVFENWCSNCRLLDSLIMPLSQGSHQVMYETVNTAGTAAAQLGIWSVDAYEPDNQPAQAKSILSRTPQVHSISPTGDSDYVKFSVSEKSALVLETSGPADSDTQLWLYNSGMAQISTDDNGGSGSYSRIERTCEANPLPIGDYIAKVNEANNDHTIAEYTLELALTPCSQPQKPDLVIDSVTFDPAQPRAGEPFSYNVAVHNLGEVEVTTPFRVDVYAGAAPTACGQAGDAYQTVNSLAAGATANLVIPGSALGSAGPFTFTALADSACAVSESIETNNHTSAMLKLLPGNFSKSGPENTAPVVSNSATLRWESSVGATGYAYCLEQSSEHTCSTGWKPITGTSILINGLSFETAYYWQVRALNDVGSTEASGGWWSFTTQARPAECSYFWKAVINLHDAGSGDGKVTIGQGAEYTDELDAACGEATLAPAPSTGSFDARLVLPNAQYETDADFRAGGQKTVTWTIHFQTGTGGYPITLSWEPSTLQKLGLFTLTDTQTGELYRLDMNWINKVTIQPKTSVSSGVRIVFTPRIPGQTVYLPAVTQ